MLSNIMKQASGSDTKALAEIFSEKKFLRSVDSDREKYKNYLADLIFSSFGDSYTKRKATLPREIIPDCVTLDAFAFTYEKDPSILPILLGYFTHINLLEDAKDDLDEINKKLQDVMDKDLKALQNEQKQLREDAVKLVGAAMGAEQAEALTIHSKKITEISSQVKKIELYKKDTELLFKGDEVKLSSYPSQYSSILENELTRVMEKKLTAYVKDNTNIEETYQSLNSRAKKIIRVRNVKNTLVLSASLAFFIPCISVMCLGMFCMGVQHGPRPSFLFPMIDITLFYIVPIMLSIAVALYATAGVAHLIKRRYEQSFEKEIQDFIEVPEHIDKATTAESGKGLGPKEEPKIGNLIDFSDHHETRNPSAPPYENEQSEHPSGKLLAQSNGSIYPTLHGGISL